MSQKNRLYLDLGQSWARGQTSVGLESKYATSYRHNNRVWNDTTFEPMYLPTNNNQYPTFGQNGGASWEFAFEDLADITTNQIYVLKFAQGSTSLYDNPVQNWNVNSGPGFMYELLLIEIAKVEAWFIARDKDFEWMGVIWGQGESDSAIELWANAYLTNINALAAGLDIATGVSLKWYQYNIELPPSGNRDYLETVNTAKAAFTALSPTTRFLFDTDVTDWSADDIHPTVPGYYELWDNKYLPLLINDL